MGKSTWGSKPNQPRYPFHGTLTKNRLPLYPTICSKHISFYLRYATTAVSDSRSGFNLHFGKNSKIWTIGWHALGAYGWPRISHPSAVLANAERTLIQAVQIYLLLYKVGLLQPLVQTSPTHLRALLGPSLKPNQSIGRVWFCLCAQWPHRQQIYLQKRIRAFPRRATIQIRACRLFSSMVRS